MPKSSNALDKLGLTQREVLHLIILQMINRSPTHAAEIYRLVSANSMKDPYGQTKSRTYVYQTIKELQDKNLIDFQTQGRKKLFYLSDEGVGYLKDYQKQLYPTLEKLIVVINHMKRTISFKTSDTLAVSISDYESSYLSKLINVKLLIRWYTLHRLSEEGTLHGGALYKDMNNWFGWMNNQGYFYQVLREMDRDGYVSSFWLDEDTRSKRGYQVSDYGQQQYKTFTTQLNKHLSEVLQALRFMIAQFNHTP